MYISIYIIVLEILVEDVEVVFLLCGRRRYLSAADAVVPVGAEAEVPGPLDALREVPGQAGAAGMVSGGDWSPPPHSLGHHHTGCGGLVALGGTEQSRIQVLRYA